MATVNENEAPVLSVENVSVTLSGQQIIHDASLYVAAGEFVGIVGPNGSGKTTLLKRIYRVIGGHEGRILLQGDDLDSLSSRQCAQHMAVVGQFNEMNFDFSVREIVGMGRTPHKKLLESYAEHDRELIHDALERVGMSDYADRSYLTLSGGEKQRVVLARALVQEPQLLILDEPTNHLDLKYQLQTLSLVRQLKVGVLAAMHDLSLAAQYCDRLYVMKGGEVVDSGPPKQLLTEALIKDIYDVECKVYENPVNGGFAFSTL